MFVPARRDYGGDSGECRRSPRMRRGAPPRVGGSPLPLPRAGAPHARVRPASTSTTCAGSRSAPSRRVLACNGAVSAGHAAPRRPTSTGLSAARTSPARSADPHGRHLRATLHLVGTGAVRDERRRRDLAAAAGRLASTRSPAHASREPPGRLRDAAGDGQPRVRSRRCRRRPIASTSSVLELPRALPDHGATFVAYRLDVLARVPEPSEARRAGRPRRQLRTSSGTACSWP